MDSKLLLGLIAVVIVLGGAYYFWPAQSWPKEEIASKINDVKNSGSSNTNANGSTNTTNTSESVKLARDPMMSGIWKSDADAKFTREFRSDGVIVDRHVGGASAGVSGKWVPIDAFKEKALAPIFQSISGKTVIKVTWDLDGKTTYFTVDSLTATKLTTTDTASNGAMTTFTKI